MMKQSPDGNDLKILRICIETECIKHDATFYMPCWWIDSSTKFGHYPAICNERAVRAGLHGLKGRRDAAGKSQQ